MTRYQKELSVGFVLWFILVGLSIGFDTWAIFIVGIAVMGIYGMCQAKHRPDSPIAYVGEFFSYAFLAAILPLALAMDSIRR